MPDPILDEINLTTLPEINDAVIEDNFFLGSVLQSHLRSKCLVPFTGGAFTRNTFLYAPLSGGAYTKGAGGFNLTKKQTLGGMVFDPRYYCVMVIEYLEDIDVLNTGDLSVFSIMETDVANAYQTISAIMALDLQKDGVNAGRGGVTMNGWVEAYNDGIVPSYDGNIYTAYGTAPRNGAVKKSINGNVYWGGNADGSAGTINYAMMNAAYNLCRRGKEEPDLIVGNKPIISFVENKLQPQQRFGQEGSSITDPYWGATGFRFKKAIVMMDDYMPSALGYPYSDDSNGGLGGNLTTTFMSPATPNLPNNFPTSKTLTVGEVLLILNTSRIRFRVSNSREFGFNPTDFIRTPDTTRVASQLKAAVNMEITAPWTGCQLYGINS
ncbi:MAG TPA: hypothetical protein VF077_07630 [Nitrospiraceae bacterium]